MLDFIKKISTNLWVVITVSSMLLIGGVLLKPETSYVTQFTPQQTESVTELYFERHTELPQQYRSGEKQEIRFTVRNTEEKNNNYQYEIMQHDATDGSSHTLKTGTISVQGNTSKTETVAVTYVDGGKVSSITVRLINENQQIRYWVKAS